MKETSLPEYHELFPRRDVADHFTLTGVQLFLAAMVIVFLLGLVSVWVQLSSFNEDVDNLSDGLSDVEDNQEAARIRGLKIRAVSCLDLLQDNGNLGALPDVCLEPEVVQYMPGVGG